MYRKTYVEVNKQNICNNIKTIINKYPFYEYYFGVVKADCYGHGDVIDAIIAGGCNYLAVATLEEALKIRKQYHDIPILCLEIIAIEYLDIAEKNSITITVASLEYAKKIKNKRGMKIHIKINTGMNRLGITNIDEFEKVYKLLQIEGVYSHIYNAVNKIDSDKQITLFQNIIKDKHIKIVHLQASEALVNYKKLDFVNATRLGIIMYGFTNYLQLLPTFVLHSEVIQIQKLKKGDSLGYNGTYIATKNEEIAVIAIGYADGIIRKNKGRYVYIHNKPYEIIGNICMDMLFIKIDDSVKEKDEVLILKDIEHINQVADYLDTIPYEIICLISKRVPRIYKNL